MTVWYFLTDTADVLALQLLRNHRGVNTPAPHWMCHYHNYFGFSTPQVHVIGMVFILVIICFPSRCQCLCLQTPTIIYWDILLHPKQIHFISENHLKGQFLYTLSGWIWENSSSGYILRHCHLINSSGVVPGRGLFVIIQLAPTSS